jgi:hypothetical protein
MTNVCSLEAYEARRLEDAFADWAPLRVHEQAVGETLAPLRPPLRLVVPGESEAFSDGECERAAARARHPSRAGRTRLTVGILATILIVLLALPLRALGGATVPSNHAGTATALVAGQQYVVGPGDTLWSIASRLHPGADPRPTVALLARQIGGDRVTVGERLTLP